MDLQENVVLSDGKHAIEIPLINLLRITMVKIQPLIVQFQQETQKSDIVAFNEWIKEKLGTKGKTVLL